MDTADGKDTSGAVVVHTIGKVGSSSVYRSLSDQTPFRCYHTHFLRKEKIEQVSKKLEGAGKTLGGHVKDGVDVLRLMETKPARIKVVSLIRDPLAREVSAFFENLSLFGIDPENLPPVDKAVEVFIERYPHDSLDRWVAEEFNRPFDVNLLAYPFPRRAGFSIFESNRYDFLFLKTEMPDARKAAVLRLFLNLNSDFALKRENVTGDKDLAGYYGEFKSRIGAKLERLRRVYDGLYCRYFYEEDEVRGFEARWRG